MTDKMPENIWIRKDEDGYIKASEKVWDDYDITCVHQYTLTSAVTAKLEAAEKLAEALYGVLIYKRDWQETMRESLKNWQRVNGVESWPPLL